MSTNGAPPAGDKAATVLICDDNDAIRELLRAVIDTALGMRVVGEAADGNEAVAEAARLQPDVILLDLAMPTRGGLEALPDLRLVAPGAQVIVFSGFASAAVAEQVVELGAAGYLEKGANPDAIVATLAQALRSNGAQPEITPVRPLDNG
jgi:two-component system invasion response regulator UvrY